MYLQFSLYLSIFRLHSLFCLQFNEILRCDFEILLFIALIGRDLCRMEDR